MKKILLFLLSIGFLSPVAGFSQFIDSVKIQYSNPSVNNHVEIIAKVYLPTLGARRLNYTSAIKNDTIYLTACYFSGPLQAPSLLIDTLSVGNLPAGIRGLHFRAYRSTNPNICDSTSFTEKSIAFIIHKPLGIRSAAATFSPQIYPNPANDYVLVESSSLKQINLRDLSGKLIQTNTYQGETTVKLNVASLPKGFYLLETVSRNGKLTRQRLLKN